MTPKEKAKEIIYKMQGIKKEGGKLNSKYLYIK